MGIALQMLAASCGGNNHTAATAPATDTAHQARQAAPAAAHVPHTRNQLTDTMLAQIVSYYRKEYGNDSTRMETSRSDTILEVSFTNTGGDSDDYHGILFIAYISLVVDINPAIHGDMNGDGKDDILFTVHTEGGGGGGNMWWDDHFLFLANPAGQYTLGDVESDGEIMDGSGYFFPKEIANQTITGIGNGYTDTDGHCCPSLYYRMHVRFTNGKLTTADKTAIHKPADL